MNKATSLNNPPMRIHRASMSRRVALERAGPLAPYLVEIARQRERLGYCAASQRACFLIGAHLGMWLALKRKPTCEIDEDLITTFLGEESATRKIGCADKKILLGLLELLRERGACPRPLPPPPSPMEKLVDDFCTYLANTRGIRPVTIFHTVRRLNGFFADELRNDPSQVSELTAEKIQRYVARYAYKFSRSHFRSALSSLKTFLNYIFLRGMLPRDLSSAVPSVAYWTLATVPRYLTQDQVASILRTPNKKTARGRRNYALLLLLARVGLRAGEASNLRLDRIDWPNGTMQIYGKGRTSTLEIPPDVGKAIENYVLRDRPRCETNQVFVTMVAPHRGLVSGSVSGIVRRACLAAGISAPSMGAHVLRHSLATEMLRRGATIAQIGRQLRHRDQDSTAIYAKVDFPSLRTIAPKWFTTNI